MREKIALSLILLASVRAWPQGSSPVPTVTFAFDNPALSPAHYTLVIRENGTGQYHSEGSSRGSDASAQGLQRDITVAEPERKGLFALARKQHLFAAECDSKHSKIAFTGQKTLSYAGPDGAGSCTFNYARDAQVEAMGAQLIAIANTLEEGRKLELLLEHDKLGLDAEMELLVTEQADGRALDLQNIAPLLRSIASDDAVLNRTRARAEALLRAESR